jgi:hypothetical protein
LCQDMRKGAAFILALGTEVEARSDHRRFVKIMGTSDLHPVSLDGSRWRKRFGVLVGS